MPKANFVSAKKLNNPTPTSLKQALSPTNQDSDVWLQSYNEEYHAIRSLQVYHEITWEDYKTIQHKCGRPIPTMCVFTVKYKDGYPDRAKSRIVVLGNQQIGRASCRERV